MKYYQKDYFEFTCKLDENFTLGKYLVETPKYRKLTLPVTDGKNKLYVTLIDFGKKDKLYYLTKKYKSVRIDWDDRKNIDFDKIHYSQYYSFGKEKYLTSFDFMNTLFAVLTSYYDCEEVKKSTLRILGEVVRNKTTNGTYTSYNIEHIHLCNSNFPLLFKRAVSVLIKPDSLITYENQFEFTGYTKVKRDNQFVYAPERFIIPFKDKDDKRKLIYEKIFDIENNQMISVLLEVQLDKEKIVEDMTEEQKLFLSLGLMTEKEVNEENTYYGSTIQNNVIRPLLKENYAKLVLVHDEKDLQNMVFE